MDRTLKLIYANIIKHHMYVLRKNNDELYYIGLSGYEPMFQILFDLENNAISAKAKSYSRQITPIYYIGQSNPVEFCKGPVIEEWTDL